MMTDQEKKLRDIAQAEFAEIRSKTLRNRSLLASTRLMILPDRFMRTFGGAAAIYRWTCISPRLLNAPEHVRKAVIAHEWGHVSSGHCNATMGALALALIYATISMTTGGGFFWPAVNLVLLGLMAWMLLWVLSPKREFEADAVAVETIGAKNMAEGLRWVRDNMRDGVETETIAERLRRLDERSGE